jgi:Beta-1,4-xylanase
MKTSKNNIKFCRSLFVVLCGLIFMFTSCYDDKMEWGRDPSYGEINPSEVPLDLQEKISRYEVLNAYAQFSLGVGIDLPLYMEDASYREVVNENFDEITVGYHMKHGAMVNAQGVLNFNRVDQLIAELEVAGLGIFGHTLVWHQNQNASYLNALIAPEVIPSPGESQLDVSALLDGSFTGWSRNNAGGITVVEGAGLNNGPALRLETTTAGNEWDTQLTSPEIPAIEGHAYEISFWIKSEAPGQGRMSFAGMVNNYPWVNGGALFDTDGSWTQITYNEVWDNAAGANVPFTATANAIKIAFDLGKVPGVYYVDINSISVIDKDAEPTEVNYVENGGFESGDFGNWNPNNQGAGMNVTGEAKFSGSYGAEIISSSTSSKAWDLQLISPDVVLDPAKTYTFSFYVKSDIEGRGRVSFPGGVNNDEYPWMDWTGSGSASEYFTTAAGVWTLISVDLTNASTIKLSFDMGYLPDVTYYIDDIKIVEKTIEARSVSLRAGPIIIEKTEEEKAQIIGDALESWITQMVGHYKGSVKAWDVVNEPMNETGGLRTGKNITEKASDEFYWQDYLGKDYAVTAFKLAREAGNTDDVLFINDYNLEYSIDKCRGLIEYVEYIEANGGQVDGIGTQMHALIDTDIEKVREMFELLAATGKRIKVSELDVRVNTASPSLEQLEQQAEIYRQIAELYTSIVPEAQRYGITLWGVTDADSWFEEDAPCLWNGDYTRKVAYKGFADGLAGRDVSEDFTGELE